MKPTTNHNRQAADADPLDAFDDPIAEFDQAVRQVMERSPGTDRQRAVIAAAKKNPALHRAFLWATNSGRRTRRLLAEKWDDLKD